MIAAVYARKSTEQTGVADEARSVTRQIVPCESLRMHERLDRAGRTERNVTRMLGVSTPVSSPATAPASPPVTERDDDDWPG